MGGEAGAARELVERLFQSQAGRLVAHFTRRLGPTHLDLAEDVVQEALLKALQSWPYTGVPSHPEGWLFRVASNAALDTIRHGLKAETLAREIAAETKHHDGASSVRPTASAEPVDDDELRMVLLCCDPALPEGARIALSLKTIGSFSAAEIARALLSTTRAVEQRLMRARREIRQRRLSMDLPRGHALAWRVDSALDVIYLLFNEGYGACGGENLIREDLCREALRLGRLVADAGAVATPRAHALVALMAFQAARTPARVDAEGCLVRLDDQDRSKWERPLVSLAFRHFTRAMQGGRETPFHLQAAIAATHAAAPVAAATDWPAILELYDALVAIEPSPVARLNRVVAVAKVRGPRAGLDAVAPLFRDRALRGMHLLPAVAADLHAQLGQRAEAARHYRRALACGGTAPERRFLERQLACLGAREV